MPDHVTDCLVIAKCGSELQSYKKLGHTQMCCFLKCKQPLSDGGIKHLLQMLMHNKLEKQAEKQAFSFNPVEKSQNLINVN